MRRVRLFTGETLGSMLLVALSTLLSLALVETALRILSPVPVFGPYFDLRPYKKLALHPELPGVSTPVIHSANKWGMRGDDPPQDWDAHHTIVAIGGSTTQCYYLDDQKAWPRRLQEKLQSSCPEIWVGNAGLDGHSSHGHLLLMEKVIGKIRPDMIVVLLGVNDMAISLSESRPGAGGSYDERFQKRLQRDRLRAWLESSRLFQILYIWKRVLWDKVTVVERTNHHAYAFEKLEGPEETLPELRDMLPSLPVFKRNVDSIITMAAAMGIKAVFLTQPSLFEDNVHWAGIKGQPFFIPKQKWRISAATEWRMVETFNRELMDLCSARGADCLDLGMLMPHDSSLFYDDYHFTDAGAEFVAEHVAGFLSSLSEFCPAKNE